MPRPLKITLIVLGCLVGLFIVLGVIGAIVGTDTDESASTETTAPTTTGAADAPTTTRAPTPTAPTTTTRAPTTTAAPAATATVAPTTTEAPTITIVDSYWSADGSTYYVVIGGVGSSTYCEVHMTLDGRRTGDWSNDLWSGIRSEITISVDFIEHEADGFEAECTPASLGASTAPATVPVTIVDSYWSADNSAYYVVIAGVDSANYCEVHMTLDGRRTGDWSNDLWSGTRPEITISVDYIQHEADGFEAECT